MLHVQDKEPDELNEIFGPGLSRVADDVRLRNRRRDRGRPIGANRTTTTGGGRGKILRQQRLDTDIKAGWPGHRCSDNATVSKLTALSGAAH
jgi:hypothetical protein